MRKKTENYVKEIKHKDKNKFLFEKIDRQRKFIYVIK